MPFHDSLNHNVGPSPPSPDMQKGSASLSFGTENLQPTELVHMHLMSYIFVDLLCSWGEPERAPVHLQFFNIHPTDLIQRNAHAHY